MKDRGTDDPTKSVKRPANAEVIFGRRNDGEHTDPGTRASAQRRRRDDSGSTLLGLIRGGKDVADPHCDPFLWLRLMVGRLP